MRLQYAHHERGSHVRDAVRREYNLWRRVLLSLVVSVSACNFDTQPLFEPITADGGVLPTAGAGRAGNAGGQAGQAGSSTVNPPPGSVTYGDASVPDDDASTTDAGATCAPGAVQACRSNAALTCKADGSGYEPIACGAAGCAPNGRACLQCQPGQTTCSGNVLRTCASDGASLSEETCGLGCGTAADGEAACSACSSGQAMCSGDGLRLCGSDGTWQTVACADGCDSSTNQCKNGRLLPTNLPQDACNASDRSDRNFEENTVLDSDDDSACWRVVAQADGAPSICVFAYDNIRVRAGVTVTVRGSRAVALLAIGDLEIDGTVSVSASGITSGSGSVQSGVGGTASTGTGIGALLSNAAGGGGGHATPGATGGGATLDCASGPCVLSGGGGGVSYGTTQLLPLQGGSPGGRNSIVNMTDRDAPGGAGGALQLVACDELKLNASAIIEANGGGGSGGSATSGNANPMSGRTDSLNGGAGGGSGGAILIQGRTVSVKEGAILVANGGGGGSGSAVSGRNGEMRRAGLAGQDGQRSTRAALGGTAVGDSLAGGAGGALDLPVAGRDVASVTQAAGGGGGAAGRIHIESAVGQVSVAGAVVSPAATTGTAQVL